MNRKEIIKKALKRVHFAKRLHEYELDQKAVWGWKEDKKYSHYDEPNSRDYACVPMDNVFWAMQNICGTVNELLREAVETADMTDREYDKWKENHGNKRA